MAKTKEEQEAFDRALDAAFTEIVKMRLEDVRRSLDRFRERVEARKMLEDALDCFRKARTNGTEN